MRCYRRGELVDTVHVLEHLYGEWKDRALHEEPVRELFDRQLERPLGALAS